MRNVSVPMQVAGGFSDRTEGATATESATRANPIRFMINLPSIKLGGSEYSIPISYRASSGAVFRRLSADTLAHKPSGAVARPKAAFSPEQILFPAWFKGPPT